MSITACKRNGAFGWPPLFPRKRGSFSTRLGRQELYADILSDNPDALFQYTQLDRLRVRMEDCPPFRRIVIGVDPPGKTGEDADECGILVAGLGDDGHGYILADEAPNAWAKRVLRAYALWNAARTRDEEESTKMGPLAWLAYRRRSKEVNLKCLEALRLLRNAAVEIRSSALLDRQARRCMPVVLTLNLLCGRHGEDRFRPLDFDLLVEALLSMEHARTLEEIAKASGDPIEQSIFFSCRMLFPQVKPITPEARRRLGVIAHYLRALVTELNRAAGVLPAH